MQTLPDKANLYLQTNFMDASLTEITETKDSRGKSVFLVDLNCNDITYHIEFNDNGDIISYDTKPMFDGDYSEDDLYPDDF